MANLFQRIAAQVNPFDNGRTFKSPTAKNNRSVVGQVTHNAVTNVAGDVVKPVPQFVIDAGNLAYNKAVAPVFHLPQQNVQVTPLAPAARFVGATGTPRQTLGSGIQTALTLASPGLKGASLLARTGANAGIGAGFGAANAYGNGGNLKQVGQGALLGGALGGAAPVAGKLAAVGGKQAARIGADLATAKPYRNVSNQELSAVARVAQARAGFGPEVTNIRPTDVNVYRGVQKKLGVDPNNHDAIDHLIGARLTYENRVAAQKQLLQNAAHPQSLNQGGYVKMPSNGDFESQMAKGKKLVNDFSKVAAQSDKLARQVSRAHATAAKGAETGSSPIELAKFLDQRLGLKSLDEKGSVPITDEAVAPTGKVATKASKAPVVAQNALTVGAKAGRQNLSPEAQALVSGEHTVRNTQALQDQAASVASKQSLNKTIQSAHEALAVAPGKIDDQTVAQVQQAIERADAAGRTADAVALHDGLSEHLTKQGQTIQAASLLYKLSPRGLFYKAMGDLKKSGTTVNPDLQAQLKSLSDDIKNASNPEDKQLATAKFYKTVADNVKQKTANNLLGVWKAGLLSGPITQAGNFASNATFAALHGVANPISAAVDKVLSVGTGQRTKTLSGQGYASGALKGIKTGLGTMKTGIDLRNIEGNKYDIHGEINFKNPVVQKVFGATSNFVFRGMSAADQPFYYAALKNNLADLAKADGINQGLKGSALQRHVTNLVANPSEHIAEQAKLAAQKSVLSEDNQLASNVSRFTQAHPLAQAVVPFVKVPTNFLVRTLDYTPVGAVKQAVKSIQSYRAGHGIEQRALSEAIGEATTGSGLIYLGAELANHNLLSGQYPSNSPKEQQRWKAEGIQPNSVKVGNKWVSLNYLGPAGLLLGAGKDYRDAAAQGSNGTIAATTGFGKNLTGQSFLTGFSNAANALNDPGRYAQNFVNQQAGSVVPGWLNAVSNATDPMQRQANTPGQMIASRLPGIREGLPAKQDVYGNPLAQRSSPAGMTLNPLKPSNDTSQRSPAIAEVSRLHSVDPNNPDLQVTPSQVNSTISVEGNKVNLNDSQRYELQQTIGQATQNSWNQLVQTPQYRGLSDIDKANALTKARQSATEDATRTYVVANNLGVYNKPESKAAIKLSNGDLTQFTNSKAKSGSSSTAPKIPKTTETKYDPKSNTWTQTNKTTGRVTLIDANGVRTVLTPGTTKARTTKAKSSTTSSRSRTATATPKVKVPSIAKLKLAKAPRAHKSNRQKSFSNLKFAKAPAIKVKLA
jgi:hypothetical protein